MRTILTFLVNRGLVVNLISVFLLAIGLYALLNINREAFPNIDLDLIQIEAHYPGSSPKEVEQLIIIPIEQELRALNGIDKIISMSFPGSGRITLELDANAANRDKIASEVTLAVNRARLPNDLPYDPFVTEINGSVFPIIRLAISAPLNELQLKRLVDNIKDDMLNIDGIAKIIILGGRKAEIRILVDPQKMTKERIAVGEIVQALQGWNLNLPGGDINTSTGQKVVRVVGEFTSAAATGELVLRSNERNDVLRLKDIATVSETLVTPRVTYDVGGKPALSLLVLKKPDGDIIDSVDAVQQYISTIQDRYGADIDVSTFQDFSKFTRLRLGVLTNNGLVGLVLVFISLLLFLRFSTAMTTTWGLPIIVLSGIFLLYSFGTTLNMISMMGFIMVLGMLVDDAIIIGENITYHMEQGMPPHAAAIQGSLELIGPVTTTIMTTIVAFMPMLFMSGMIGKFIIAIPIVVITLLLLSWLESFLILPSHVALITNPHKHPPEKRWITALENIYGWVLVQAIRFRWITVLLSVIVLIAALMLAKTMPFQLFPTVGVDEFIVRVTAPPGTSLNTMRDNMRKIDTQLRQHIKPDVLEATLIKTGDISLDLGDPLTQRGARYGQIRVIYTPSISRPDHDTLSEMHALAKIIPALFPDLDIAFTEIRPGPPVGRALEAEISSYDNKSSLQAAKRLMSYLQTIEGVTTVDSGLKKGDDELHVVLDQQKATYVGVNLATAAQHIRAASGGLIVSSVRHGTEEIDITIRFPSGSEELKNLKELLIPNKTQGLIPLHKIAHFEQREGFTTIRHKDGIRIVSVVADIDNTQLTSLELNKIVRTHSADWLGDLANKVDIRYGGEQEKNKESFISLAIAFIFALIAIFFILAIQFNNMSYPIIVMLAIPFGAIGIIISFYFHDMFWKPMPLSFFAMLGMVALTGVVVNSSLILLVFIQRAIQSGMNAHEAIIQAGRRRLRAVLLTATTTVVGLLPTAYGWGGMDRFVSPMALALASGLMFATVVTLVSIPAAFAAGLDISHFFNRLFRIKKKA